MQREVKNCQNCKQDFTIEPEDFVFYEKIKVPPPTFCPTCCLQRRMMFRNERTLYKRENNAPGKEGEQIVSIHRPDTQYTIFDDRSWWSDKWDPMDYGKEYDFSKTFFEQFKELYEKIPLINLSITNMVNCRYCNVSEGDKNCFMISASNKNEDSMYANRVTGNKQSSELYIANYNELCYELINSSKNYRVFWSSHAYECSDSAFLSNCKNVQDCIGCINLRNVSYHILNKEYTRDEYLKEKKNLRLDSIEGVYAFKAKFDDFVKKHIHKYVNSQKAVNSTGDNLENVSNVKNSFDIYEAQDCKNVVWGGYGLRDSHSAGPGVGVQSELLYDCFDTALQASKCLWTGVVYHSFDIRYSINCHSSSNLFGCHGLRSKEYCILNKQYTKEEYEKLVPKIIEHMNSMPYVDSKGRVFKYGDFLPYDISSFMYNETIAQEYFPLSRDQVAGSGWGWYDRPDRHYAPTLKIENLPQAINEVEDSILAEIIECKNKGSEISACTNAFKVMPEELAFYRRLSIPLPMYCPNCRHYNRLQRRNPMQLWHRACMCDKSSHNNHQGKCEVEFETSYTPERTEIIYCEKCYQQEVY